MPMPLPLFLKPGGLHARLYAAFLVSALVPIAIAGFVGIHYSIQALRDETLSHLNQEVASRAETIGRFMEQLASEVLYLSASSALDEMLASRSDAARQRLERDFAVFATAYPYIYQARFLDASGHEVVRVDRQPDGLHVVPRAALQDKSDRYYFRAGMDMAPGQIYVSPLDLNVEHGRVEKPARPVVRVSTPVAGADGRRLGLLIINLHAELFLRQVQEMAQVHGGEAYLFDRSGYFLRQVGEDAADPGGRTFAMQSVVDLGTDFPMAALPDILRGERGVRIGEGRVAAFAPVNLRPLSGHQGSTPQAWALALIYPQGRFFSAVFNLYLLYALLVAALAVTAFAGWLVSHRLLRRLVDERREQDRQVFQREKMNTLGELAMGVAHEIGNPLAGMKAVVQVLGREPGPSPAMARYLPRLEHEIDRLAGFLRSFHGFTAPQAHQPVSCRLADVLDDVLLWTRKEAKEKGIAIHFRDCERDVPPLLADPNQLKQLLLNMIINAIHAIDGPGSINLAMCNRPETAAAGTAARRRVHFCIEDSGPGISAEVRQRMFEPFFTTRADGTGLGLSVVKKIADQHEAEIRVHPRAPHGTRFEFIWPAAARRPSTEKPNHE